MKNTQNNPRIALVTGGGTGIGAACCRELTKVGFTVAIHYNHSREAAETLQAELQGAFLLQADLSTQLGMDSIYHELRERGGVEVLVNNAGITIDAPLLSAKIEDFDRVIATNMRSTWYLTKRLARLMIRQRHGRIINISSVVGSIGNPTQTIYSMTKAAIDNFTKTAAIELSPYNILVNSIAPGFIATRMTEMLSEQARDAILSRIPLGRIGTSEEVAQFVRFLAVEGSYCTGAVFHINGGMYGG
ncbi:3-oxoacyl-ACP reductase FabG [Candidatus Acetothermia bacterium]|nr:3-oxoacyl-ACP reductase FabG [Candidatus Acetothermia bacterium]MCI2427622.1 3-oxoacyl-ACP reductase FabG [Candidatus Acetothermia bacterium]MCI2428471.1 3-oxoacyl-ACP reductase FabG [Candidatus Acetothermia bacterium]